MKLKLSDLWRWDGELGRDAYVFWGCLLFFTKFQLDRILSWTLFGRDLDPWFYVAPWELVATVKEEILSKAITPTAGLAAPGDETAWGEALYYVVSMVLLSLPFIYTGVMMTLRRLRSAGMPLPLVSVFFFPVIHYLFFAILALAPPKVAVLETAQEEMSNVPPLKPPSFLTRLIPEHWVGNAVLGAFLSAGLAVVFCTLAVSLFKDYGWSLMVGLPFTIGLIPVLLNGYHRRRSLILCLLTAWLATIFTGVALVAVRIEGLVCLIFLLPIALVFSTFGGLVGYFIQSQRWANHNTFQSILAVLACLPLMMGAEHQLKPVAPLYAVTTDIVVNAPASVVWTHVVTFRQLPEPTEPWFKMGISYPQKAIIYGQGVGAIRHCIFSTGPFIEPITVWDEPRLLKFSVAKQPPPMKELSPFTDFSPPHLDNYLRSEGGQFLLTPLSDTQTRISGTTWYRHKAWPQRYWKLWSDAVIHNIHERVLTTIKADSESAFTLQNSQKETGPNRPAS